MPPRDPDERGASGRPALRALRDDDYEDVVAAVAYLPELRRNEGVEAAVAFVQTELASLVDMLFLAKPESPEAALRGAWLATLWEDGPARLLTDDDRAGFNWRVEVTRIIERERFAPAVRAVFERSAPVTERAYAPNVSP